MKKLLISLSIILSTYSCYSQQTIELTNWKFQTGDNMEWAKPNFDDSAWKPINPGINWEAQGYPGYDGYAWYRVTFRLPSEMKKDPHAESIQLLLGKIEDCDQVFLNGKLLGQNAKLVPAGNTAPLDDLSKLPRAEGVVRNYTVSPDDPRLLWDRENVLSVRVFDATGNDGGVWVFEPTGKGGMSSLPANISCIVPALKDYLVLDAGSTSLETKPGSIKSKTLILKNKASFEAKGKLITEITDEETGKAIATQSQEVALKKGETPVTVSFKGKPLQKIKATYTFTEPTTGDKLTATWSNIPRVDFSYAFGTPHRITVGRPTNSNRTILDVKEGSLNMHWTYLGVAQVPSGAAIVPSAYSPTWSVDIRPQIDGKPFAISSWIRLDKYLPGLDNTYTDPRGSVKMQIIGGETASIGKVEIVNTDMAPHQFSIICKSPNDWLIANKAWIDPGRWSADCLTSLFGERNDRVILLGLGGEKWVDSANGKPIDPTTLSFIWNMKPGEKRTAWIIRPYNSFEDDLPAMRQHNWAKEFDAGKQEWHNLLNQMDKVSIPDENVMDALQASFSDLFIMREPVGNGYIGHTAGTEMYRGLLSLETHLASLAVDQFGLHQEAADELRLHIDRQDANGDWNDPKTGWDILNYGASGFKSWAVMEHYKLTGNKEFLEKVYPRMLANSRYQESQRARTRGLINGVRPLNCGLLPPGFGDCGLFSDNDRFGIFIPHNIQSVYADSLTLEAARVLKKINNIEELEQIFRTAKTELIYTMDKGAIHEDGYRWIPGVAGKTSGSRYGVLNALFPCHILSSNDELITGTLRYMESNISRGGMPLRTGFMKNGSWVAMTLDNVAEAYLARGNGDKAAHYLYAALNHCTPLFTNVEERGQEPGTLELSGDLEHLWTPIAVVRIIRDMLVMEDGDGLNLALGTDRTWLASGKPVGVTDMPTHFGNVTYQMQYDPKKGTVTGEIKLAPKPNQQTCQWTTLHIRLPEGMKVTSVDKASKATVLPNGEGIKWQGQITNVKFTARVK